MKNMVKKALSLCLVLAVLLSMAAILPASAKGGENAAAVTDAKQSYDVVAVDGVITPKHGKLVNGKAKYGTVMTIALDESARPDNTFLYWKSAYGEIVDETSFEVYIDRDVYFYPVYSDLNADLGAWTLLKLRNCELGDVYVRSDARLGYSQYKRKFYGWGGHDEFEYVNVDENTCRRICKHCGWYEDCEHDLSYTVVKEPTADETGLAEYRCINGCGYSCTQEIDALGVQEHDHQWLDTYDDIIIEAKDGQPGKRRVHCALCDATKDVWYIKAEWEKYYFGNHVFFDSSDSSGLWGTDDEHHYSFVNAEGYNTYLYAVREDYRDNDTCFEFLWIDHADELGRKPLYAAKSMGQTEYNIYNPYSWAVIDYDITTVDEYISFIDHFGVGDDRYSSSFFDNVKRYETLYNQQMFPADGSSDFLTNMNGTWVYESDDSLRVDEQTGIAYYDIMFNDRREFLHIDPLTNCVILRYEPNASSRWCEIKQIKPIVTTDEYEAIIAAYPWTAATPAPEANPGEDIQGHGDNHDYSNYYQQECVNEEYHKQVCQTCGKELYGEHELSVRTPHLSFDDLTASTATYYCPLCQYEEEQPYLMTTAEIQQNLYNYFRNKSTRSISLNNDVLHTPNPTNFQLRVDNVYLVGGPDDSTYTEGHGGYNRYASNGYAATYSYSYDGSQGDYFAFGVIRAGDSDYAGVELKLPEKANYVFQRWEIYDWATGTWQLFSVEETPRFNEIVTEWDANWNPVVVSDTRVNDLTILRAVREYVEPERYNVKVVGGTFYAETEDWTEQRAEGAVDANAKIYLNYDNDAVPVGKEFDHYDVYNKDGDLIDTTDGWGYTVAEDGVVFETAYRDRNFYLSVYAENGMVYLVNGPAGGKEDDKPGVEVGVDLSGSGKDEEYWGGEYPAGTEITVTTASENEEEYPYFLGWYYSVYTEEGEERELLTASLELTVTVTAKGDKDEYGSYVAVWSDVENPPAEITYRTLHVNQGFVSYRQMRDSLFLSCVRVPYYSTVSLMLDPGVFIDVEEWTLTGSFANEEPYSETFYPDDGEFWFDGEDCAPAHVYATPVGESNLVFADGDGDGNVTVNDATRIQRVLAELTDDYGRLDLSCDISGNGRVDIVDAALIQRYLVGFDVPNQEKIGALIEVTG